MTPNPTPGDAEAQVAASAMNRDGLPMPMPLTAEQRELIRDIRLAFDYRQARVASLHFEQLIRVTWPDVSDLALAAVLSGQKDMMEEALDREDNQP